MVFCSSDRELGPWSQPGLTPIRSIVGFRLQLSIDCPRAFHFEGKILLGHITERHHDGRGDDFCNRGVKVEMFHKETDKNVVQDHTDQYQQEIPK